MSGRLLPRIRPRVRNAPQPDARVSRAEALAHLAAIAAETDDEDELTTASNAAVDLVHACKLEEAEAAARDLLARFPEVHDGWDRVGMVDEARGQKKQGCGLPPQGDRDHSPATRL